MMQTRILILALILLLAAMPAVAGITPTPGSHSLVVTQFYVGGYNSVTAAPTGSPYAFSYLEIMNTAATRVDLQNWTIQYETGAQTQQFFSSYTYPIGNLDKFKSGTTGGDDGAGNFCTHGQCLAAYTSTFKNSNCEAAATGTEQTPHCWLNPGQYMLILLPTAGTAGCAGNAACQAFPLAADLDLSTGTPGNGGTNLTGGVGPKFSATTGKFVLATGTNGVYDPNLLNSTTHAPANSCEYVPLTAAGKGNPVPNQIFPPSYSDFIGYGALTTSNATNCWEGPSPTAQTDPTLPIPNGPVWFGTAAGPVKNFSALYRTQNFAGVLPSTLAPTPCGDTDNNITDFAPVVVGNAGATPQGASNWILHNSQNQYTVAGGSVPYVVTPCPGVSAVNLPTVEVSASPSIVQANTATPVTLTLTVTDGGKNPVSATYEITADLSVLGSALVEAATTTEGSTPQMFGFLNADPNLGLFYQYPPPVQSTTATPQVSMNINGPVGSYSIPITVLDDAYRTQSTSVSIKIMTNTPGQATASMTPTSIVQGNATPVTLTATITDPGVFPTGQTFSGTADLSSIGGGATVPLASSGTDYIHLSSGPTTITAPTLGTFTIPVTITDDTNRILTITSAAIQVTVASDSPIASLSYTGAPGALNFGNVNMGSNSTSVVTLTNTGTVALTINGMAAGGDFSEHNDDCPAPSLAAGASCHITVTFTPSQIGIRNGTSLSISDNANGSPQTVALVGNGVGVPQANLDKASLTFGSYLVGKSSPSQTITLSNTGAARLNFSIVPSGDFAQANTSSCGTYLDASTSCTIDIVFAPTVTGTRPGSLTITDNANNIAGTQQSVGLTGNGMDFPVAAVSTGGDSKSVSAGQPATYNLQLTPQGGFSGLVTFACTGAPPFPPLPQLATCNVPPSVNVSGAAPIPVTVTVTTTAPLTQTAQANLGAPIVAGSQGDPGSGGSHMPLTAGSLLALAIGGVFASSKKARKHWRATATCGALLCVIGLAACSGLKSHPWPTNSQPGTLAGTYTVTLTATSGGVTHTIPLTLTVTVN